MPTVSDSDHFIENKMALEIIYGCVAGLSLYFTCDFNFSVTLYLPSHSGLTSKTNTRQRNAEHICLAEETKHSFENPIFLLGQYA